MTEENKDPQVIGIVAEPERMHVNPLAKSDVFYRHMASDRKCPLMLFSGGLDSTYLLDKYTQTEDSCVDLVHAFLGNNGWKNQCETTAINNIVNHLQDRWYRQYNEDRNIGTEIPRRADDYTNSRIHRLHNVDVGVTQQAFGFSQMGRWLMALMNNVNPERHTQVMMGYVAGDQASAAVGDLKNGWHYLWEACMQGSPLVPLVFPITHVSKQRILRELSPELVALTWTCETPTWHAEEGFASCGTCPACERSIMEKHYHKLTMRRNRIRDRRDEATRAQRKDEWVATLDRISKMDNTPIEPPEHLKGLHESLMGTAGPVATEDESESIMVHQPPEDAEPATDRRDAIKWHKVQDTGATYDPHAR